MGWIIRNPFYNWFHSDFLKECEPIDKEKRYEALKIGAQAAATYFNDNRFLMLPDAFNLAYQNLPNYIDKFYRLIDAWDKFKTKLNT